MFTPLHRALGLEPGSFDWELLERAVADGVLEAVDLDWKQALYHPKDPAWREEAAKDMAAMANSGGGWIVFGVKEEGERARELVPVEWNAGEEQRLRQVAFARVMPAVMGVEFHVVTAPGSEGAVVGMRVPATQEAPHFARGTDDNTLRCPKRDGAHTVFMSERDIERAYRARFERRSDWTRLLAELQEDALALTDFSEYVGALAVAAPREDLDPVPLDERDAVDVLNTARYGPFYEERSHYPCLPHEHNARPGYRSIRFLDNVRDASVGACTLRQDGAVSLTMHLGRLGLEQDRTPDTAASQWVFKSVADFMGLVVTHARKMGHAGTYGAVYELRGPSPFYIELGRSHPFSLQRRGDLTPIRRFTPVVFEIDPQASDDDMLSMAKTTARDVVNQGGLFDLGLAALERS